MTLDGRTAIVTGSGGSGCGRAIALRLAAEGMRVVVSDIDEAGRVSKTHQVGPGAGFRHPS